MSETTQQTDLIIHAFRQGVALCGLKRSEAGWPEGHSGIAYTKLNCITCPACKEAAKEQIGQEAY